MRSFEILASPADCRAAKGSFSQYGQIKVVIHDLFSKLPQKKNIYSLLQGSETCFLLSWGSTPAAERMLHEECLVTKHSTVPGRKMKSWSKQKLNRVKGEAYVGNQPGPQLII